MIYIIYHFKSLGTDSAAGGAGTFKKSARMAELAKHETR
jgi:hypothetical protein